MDEKSESLPKSGSPTEKSLSKVIASVDHIDPTRVIDTTPAVMANMMDTNENTDKNTVKNTVNAVDDVKDVNVKSIQDAGHSRAKDPEKEEETEKDESNDHDTNSSVAETKPKPKDGVLKNYFRILTFGTKLDHFLLACCMATGIGSGIAMPLMFVVFGRLVGNFAGYFTPGSTVTKDQFMHQVVQNTLYMVYIGIARFALSFISLVRFPRTNHTNK
jgi:hypothetical protein